MLTNNYIESNKKRRQLFGIDRAAAVLFKRGDIMKNYRAVEIESEIFGNVLFKWFGGSGVNVFINDSEIDYFNIIGLKEEELEEICAEHLKEMEEEAGA